MEGALIIFAIVGPISGLIILYRLLNNGEYPCININLARVFVGETN